MLRRIALALVLILLAGPALVAEDGGGFGGFDGKPGKDAKAADDAKAKAKPAARKDAAADAVPSPVPPAGGSPEADKAIADRGKTLEALRAYCAERKLPIAEHAGKAVRLLVVGAVTVDAQQVVDHADLALIGLETWTGKTGAFMRDGMPADEIYTLALFPDAGARDGFIDRAFAGGDVALAKKAGSLSFARGNFTDVRILPAVRWWAVFAAARAAIDAFYLERGQKPQVWLREGLACELQRLVCENQVKMYSIAYQDNAVKLDGDWAKDVAQLIKTKDQLLVPGASVMLMDVIKIPAQHYKQMWSLATFVRGLAKSEKGGANKLLRLFAETAKGTAARDAVKEIYGLDDPKLTQAWHAWALQGK